MASYDLNKLECVRANPDGTKQARCPICFLRNGADKTGNHLKVWQNGGFNCVVDQSPSHVAAIRSFLRGNGTDDIEYIDPQPKLVSETIYPESSLATLIPDYSYWLKRGIREDVLKKLECGLASKETKGKLSGRTVFPLRNMDGKISGWSGRLVENNSFAPRWKHLGKLSHLVYSWQVSGPYIEKTKTAILVESVGDYLSLLSYDINPVICIFGLNIGDRVISTLIGASVNRVFISLNRDSDPRKGQAAADKIARKLSPFISDVRVRLPNGFKDWGDAIQGGEKGLAELKAFREEIS